LEIAELGCHLAAIQTAPMTQIWYTLYIYIYTYWTNGGFLSKWFNVKRSSRTTWAIAARHPCWLMISLVNLLPKKYIGGYHQPWFGNSALNNTGVFHENNMSRKLMNIPYMISHMSINQYYNIYSIILPLISNIPIWYIYIVPLIYSRYLIIFPLYSIWYSLLYSHFILIIFLLYSRYIYIYSHCPRTYSHYMFYHIPIIFPLYSILYSHDFPIIFPPYYIP
jgi:hypothetical protein